MKVITSDGFFNDSEIEAIDTAVMEVNNKLVAPYADTGEFIIDYRLEGEKEFTCAYRATLDDGPGGSCAEAKVNTLIAHEDVTCTGLLLREELAEGEVCWYGSNRLFGEIDLNPDTEESELTPVEFIVAFSDRKEWQDELYVAAIRSAISKFSAISEDSLNDDTTVGTARNIIYDCCI